MNSPGSRVEHVPFRDEPARACADDHVVLRLSREALRLQPPAVRFIGRSGGGSLQQRFPWLA